MVESEIRLAVVVKSMAIENYVQLVIPRFYGYYDY